MEKRKAAASDTTRTKRMKNSHETVKIPEKYLYLKENVDPRPDVYTKMPPQPKEKKPGQLTEEQLKQFFDKGFVVVKNYFDTALLDKAKDAINGLVDLLANTLYDAGKIKDRHEQRGFSDRLIYIERDYPGAAVVLHKLGILPQAFKDIWTNENLLNAIEQMIGPEIAGHPVWNLRTKTPRNHYVTVPWHQDNSYLEPCSQNVLQPTAWIPFINATKKTGCMEMASYGHLKGITAPHTCCSGGTWYVELNEDEMAEKLDVNLKKDLEICEVPYGGVLFLNNAIPHRSLENYSDMIRWSIDLRWQRPDMPNGFYGTDSVLMRTAKDPNYKVDWSDMEKVRAVNLENLSPDSEVLKPVIAGPWMHRWERTHDNQHTELLTKGVSNYHTVEDKP